MDNVQKGQLLYLSVDLVLCFFNLSYNILPKKQFVQL
jgi:hypothetical protein